MKLDPTREDIARSVKKSFPYIITTARNWPGGLWDHIYVKEKEGVKTNGHVENWVIKE